MGQRACLDEHQRLHPPTGPDARTLQILGPPFPGSLVSLERDLAQLKTSPAVLETGKALVPFFPSAATPIRILSGSVSRCSTARWFRHAMQLARPAPTVFGSFQQSDELEIFRFLNYLKEQSLALKDVAIVSEDETAYANSSPLKSRTPSQPLPAPSSMPATTVRCASPTHATSPLSAPRTKGIRLQLRRHGGHAVLRENAELEGEASNITDTIRSYSGSFTPVAEETILYGIVSNLRAHHARYILLRCTNPLDFIFLTRFFHRAYPEGRIVTVGSDLLFRREIDTTEFRGVLALSNYPLLPKAQHWAQPVRPVGRCVAHPAYPSHPGFHDGGRLPRRPLSLRRRRTATAIHRPRRPAHPALQRGPSRLR